MTKDQRVPEDGDIRKVKIVYRKNNSQCFLLNCLFLEHLVGSSPCTILLHLHLLWQSLRSTIIMRLNPSKKGLNVSVHQDTHIYLIETHIDACACTHTHTCIHANLLHILKLIRSECNLNFILSSFIAAPLAFILMHHSCSVCCIETWGHVIIALNVEPSTGYMPGSSHH